jgi:transcriptional regulator with XRE-family HTH domain
VAREPRPRVVSDLNSELTELLRDMRHQAGLTQAQLGKRLGWTTPSGFSSVGQYEQQLRTPKLELVGRWAAACGYTARLVIGDSNALQPRWVVPLNDGPRP